MTSEGEKIKARGSSYVNATLDLDGLEVVHDAIYLIKDLARGVIPFDTDTQVNGKLGLFFLSIPIEVLSAGSDLCSLYWNQFVNSVLSCYLSLKNFRWGFDCPSKDSE